MEPAGAKPATKKKVKERQGQLLQEPSYTLPLRMTSDAGLQLERRRSCVQSQCQ